MQAHTGFATGELGYRYETTLCEAFANSLHFVNVLAQRYKCAPQLSYWGACAAQRIAALHQQLAGPRMLATCQSAITASRGN